MGSVVAACTNATISSDVEMVVIIQPAPTVWTRPPKLDARVAVHKARKEACLNGAKGETLIRISVPWLGYSRSEEHTSELQSLMSISYTDYVLKKKKHQIHYLASP